MTLLRRRLVLCGLGLAALVTPSSAFGQASRTWVSGVGDDASPCSRTAPCKTFAGALGKTATRGEINCLDPGGFGGVTINRAITIKCQHTEGGVLVSGTNGIVVNAPQNAQVTLRGLDIDGLGTGLNGIKVLQARHVNITDSEISGFAGAGIDVNPSGGASVAVLAARNHIHDVGIGVINAPGTNAVGVSRVVVRHNDLQDTICAVVSSAYGQNASVPSAWFDCGSATAASGIDRPAITGIYHTGINLNNVGVFSRGGSSTAEIAYNEITGNAVFGLRRVDGGHIKTFAPATNVISDNAGGDPPDLTIGLTKR